MQCLLLNKEWEAFKVENRERALLTNIYLNLHPKLSKPPLHVKTPDRLGETIDSQDLNIHYILQIRASVLRQEIVQTSP